MRMCSTILAACFAVAGVQPVVLLACGYDNPQAVALGSLNWVYPDALHVVSAVTQAEHAGLLPRDSGAQSGPFAFYRATSAMKSFGARLADPRLAETPSAVSVVLLPQAMWTRFQIGFEGVLVQSHIESSLGDDLVVVTEEKVVRALLDEKLELATAEENGLLRFYGQPKLIAKVRATLTEISRAEQVLPVRFSGTAQMPPSGSGNVAKSAAPETF